MRKIIYAGCGLLAIALLVAVVYMRATPSQEKVVEASGKAQIGGAFVLQDTNGAVVHDTDFMGKWMLVYFGFTYCPDVCPLGLSTISQVLTILGPEAIKVQPIFITIDPERDTPAQMKSYLTHFSPQIRGLTGTKDQVQQAAAAYRVYYNKVEEGKGKDYLMDHSAFIYLMDRNGNYVTHFPSSANAMQIASAIKKQL